MSTHDNIDSTAEVFSGVKGRQNPLHERDGA